MRYVLALVLLAACSTAPMPADAGVDATADSGPHDAAPSYSCAADCVVDRNTCPTATPCVGTTTAADAFCSGCMLSPCRSGETLGCWTTEYWCLYAGTGLDQPTCVSP